MLSTQVNNAYFCAYIIKFFFSFICHRMLDLYLFSSEIQPYLHYFVLLVLIFLSCTCRFLSVSLSIKALGSALFHSPMKSDEVLQGLKSYDLSHHCLNQTPGATAQSQSCFGSTFLQSPCRCSVCFTVELVTAIIVQGRRCPCSGALLAAGGDKFVPFTRRREMATRRKAAGSQTLNHILGTSTAWPCYPRLSLPDILHCQSLQGTADLCIWTLLNTPLPLFSL